MRSHSTGRSGDRSFTYFTLTAPDHNLFASKQFILKIISSFHLEVIAELFAQVIAGTASEGVLRVGDVITAIKGQDATCLSHQEATELFKSAGNQLDLVLAR
ncbi:hypothetical protein FJT64_013952 [Amphibalanus amphitrite]|uniref:PDZ domain-containing protein n=1 Tax=Amphibalanus amphitrite TaxID=1232801 RepID=A0A6A4V231_AMPAM|nr:hypothetical protein FJT64_013952 [Amphibalanus amphitrite]